MTPRTKPRNVNNADYEETLELAHLLYYTDVVARARRAFAYANEARAAYTSPRDADRRIQPIEQAFAFRDILQYMEESGTSQFSIYGFRLWEARLARRLMPLFSPYYWWLTFRIYAGRKPLAWWKLPDPGEGEQ